MLDQATLDIIKAKPIGNGLDAFRDSFKSVVNGLGLLASSDALNQISDEGIVCYPFV
jgi:hypothetical protein